MSRLPVPGGGGGALRPAAAGGRDLARDAAPPPPPRARDFLRLLVFVLAQQGYVDRAGVLAEALYLTGETGAEVQLARAVLRFLAGEWSATLACLEELDRIDPVERFGDYTLDEAQRMRRFLAARCLFELGDAAGSRDALDSYLRRAKTGG